MLLCKADIGWVPADDEAREKYRKTKPGSYVDATIKQPRNLFFHRKWFALLQIAFDYWEEIAEPIKYRGQDVQPDFDRFRKDITILCGKYHFVVNVKNEIRTEADSISFAAMTEDTFTDLYDKTITVLLSQIMKGSKWNEEVLRSAVDQVVGFAQ